MKPRRNRALGFGVCPKQRRAAAQGRAERCAVREPPLARLGAARRVRALPPTSGPAGENWWLFSRERGQRRREFRVGWLAGRVGLGRAEPGFETCCYLTCREIGDLYRRCRASIAFGKTAERTPRIPPQLGKQVRILDVPTQLFCQIRHLALQSKGRLIKHV